MSETLPRPLRALFFLAWLPLASCGGGADLPGVENRLQDFAIGQVREIPSESLRVEFKDLNDSRCPAAAVCVAAVGVHFARVDLLVSQAGGQAVPLSVTIDAGPQDDQAQALGYRFKLEALEPYPQVGPYPKDQYRARILVTRP